jgi:DNA-directed RNA polymerase specialized sigma24 family protein
VTRQGGLSRRSSGEIARTLDLSIGSVKQHIFRGIRSLRRVVEEDR